MRLLVVTHYYAEHGGGIEGVAAELVRRLARRGFDIAWAASGTAAGDGTADRAAASADSCRRVPMRSWNIAERRLGFPYPVWGPLGLWRLWREVRRCRIVHLHDALYMGSFFAYALARLAGRPVVVTQHIGFVPYSSALLRGLLGLANRTLARMVLGGADHCVFVSSKVELYFRRLLKPSRRMRLISNGVDPALFHPLPEESRGRLRAALGWPQDRPVLLFVGRFVEKKGIAVLRQLATRLPEALWAFAGWGPHDPAGWGLPNVRCMGALPHRELARAYQAADLLVLPSVGEGFPLVVQEAMACGTPALISPDTAAGCPAVTPLTFLAEPKVEAFAERLRELLEAPEELAARRPAVSELAHRLWSWEEAADAYSQLFAELAPASGAGGASGTARPDA